MTLTEFLLAWIAEDEAAAHAADVIAPGVADRVLAECQAKRLAVRFLGDLERGEFGDVMTSSVAYSVLARMAAVYADHPDYREEWKP